MTKFLHALSDGDDLADWLWASRHTMPDTTKILNALRNASKKI
ncbi:hypothetical protein N9P17_02405 [Tateyamaria sp.]|nr:hypothetical protein [Tateyamaria sp.]